MVIVYDSKVFHGILEDMWEIINASFQIKNVVHNITVVVCIFLRQEFLCIATVHFMRSYSFHKQTICFTFSFIFRSFIWNSDFKIIVTENTIGIQSTIETGFGDKLKSRNLRGPNLPYRKEYCPYYYWIIYIHLVCN